MQNYCLNCMKPLGDSPICAFCGFDNSTRSVSEPYHLSPGTMLAGKYLVGRVLGEGGFGITYIGLHTALSRRVAIKEFYPSGAANRTNRVSEEIIVTHGKEDFFRKGVERFLFEAKNVAAFSEEEGIVDVMDYFQENNTAYIVMEYLEGETLKDCLKNHGLFLPDRLIDLMLPLMRSLGAMHQKGIIHRDISPDNIMYTTNGKLKLMDFGSARYFTNEERQMSVILKQGFAPEEQYRPTAKQGPYTDVYALCATIYTCITGRVPVNSLERLDNDTLQPPSALGFSIKPHQERALMHGLAVKASDRTPDVNTLIYELTNDNGTVIPQQAAQISGQNTQASWQPSQQPTRQPQQPVNNNPGYGAYQPSPEQNKNNVFKLLAIIIPIIVLAATAIILVIALNARNNGSETPPPVSQKSSSHASSRVPDKTDSFFSSGGASGNSQSSSKPSGSSSSAASSSSSSSSGSSSSDNSSSGSSSSGSSSSESSSSNSSSNESSAVTTGLSLAEAKANVDGLKKFFAENVANSDDKAGEGDDIELKSIYYTISTKSNFNRIAYVYYNKTRSYYRVISIDPERIYNNNGTIEGYTRPSFLSYKTGETEQEAMESCWFIVSTTDRYDNTKLL